MYLLNDVKVSAMNVGAWALWAVSFILMIASTVIRNHYGLSLGNFGLIAAAAAGTLHIKQSLARLAQLARNLHKHDDEDHAALAAVRDITR